MSAHLPTPAVTSRQLPAAYLVGGAFFLSTVTSVLIFCGIIALTNTDPYKPEGAVESIQGISLFGTAGLLVALAIALGLRSNAQIAAIVLAVLAIITVPFFWSGAPATFGAAAAWRAGFAKGSEPQAGPARGFGIVGIVVAILVIVGGWAGFVGALLTGNY